MVDVRGALMPAAAAAACSSRSSIGTSAREVRGKGVTERVAKHWGPAQ